MVFKVSVCYFLSNFYFHQMIALQKLLKMFFISPNRHEKSPGTHGFPRFLFQLHINFFVCIKLPNSCIYAIKLRCVCVCVCVCVCESSCHKFQGNCVFDNYKPQKSPGPHWGGGGLQRSPSQSPSCSYLASLPTLSLLHYAQKVFLIFY